MLIPFRQDPSERGTFFPAENFRVSFGSTSFAIGDLNEDTLPDIAVADEDGAVVLFQDPTQPGDFLPPEKVGKLKKPHTRSRHVQAET